MKKFTKLKLDQVKMLSKYTFESQIGVGSTAHVYKVAVKKYKDNDHVKCANEMLILKQCSHKNILKIFDFGDLHIVMELMKGNILSIPKLKRYTYEIMHSVASGLQHMHSVGWAHMDITCNNILYTKEKDKYVFKISDMGFAINKQSLNKYTCGTYIYMDPNACKVIPNRTMQDCFCTDIWTLGMIGLVICTEQLPNLSILKKYHPEIINISNDEMVPKIIAKLNDEDYEPYIETGVPYNIIKEIVKVDPSQRQTLEWVIMKLKKVLEC